MILVVDNHDSFTWNIVHYLRELGAELAVVQSDAVDVDEAMRRGTSGLLIAPGPGTPDDAGISLALVATCAAARRPLLGVCLGHQAIAQALGGRIVRAERAMHGKTSAIIHDATGVFAGLPSPFVATRYHSLAVAPDSVPDVLLVNARADDGSIQGFRHRDLPIHGVQFHPESVASEHGHALLQNFVILSAAHGA